MEFFTVANSEKENVRVNFKTNISRNVIKYFWFKKSIWIRFKINSFWNIQFFFKLAIKTLVPQRIQLTKSTCNLC